MRRGLRPAVLALSLLAGIGAASATDVALAVGQVWSVKERPALQVTIGRIEPHNATQAIHVAITGATVPSGTPDGPTPLAISQMAFEEAIFRSSVDTLLQVDGSVTRSFEDSYARWAASQTRYVFQIPISAAVDLAVEQVRRANAAAAQ